MADTNTQSKEIQFSISQENQQNTIITHTKLTSDSQNPTQPAVEAEAADTAAAADALSNPNSNAQQQAYSAAEATHVLHTDTLAPQQQHVSSPDLRQTSQTDDQPSLAETRDRIRSCGPPRMP